MIGKLGGKGYNHRNDYDYDYNRVGRDLQKILLPQSLKFEVGTFLFHATCFK